MQGGEDDGHRPSLPPTSSWRHRPPRGTAELGKWAPRVVAGTMGYWTVGFGMIVGPNECEVQQNGIRPRTGPPRTTNSVTVAK